MIDFCWHLLLIIQSSESFIKLNILQLAILYQNKGYQPPPKITIFWYFRCFEFSDRSRKELGFPINLTSKCYFCGKLLNTKYFLHLFEYSHTVPVKLTVEDRSNSYPGNLSSDSMSFCDLYCRFHLMICYCRQFEAPFVLFVFLSVYLRLLSFS